MISPLNESRREFLKRVALTAGSAAVAGRVRAAQVPAAAAAAGLRDPLRRDFFYRPQGAYCGDFMGFFENGVYYLFYLHGLRPRTDAVSWYLISTRDFVTFQEHGEVIPRGSKDAQDYSAVTGSVLKASGKYHAFYCGRNNIWRREGRPGEAIMHAVSDDLLHWTKVPGDSILAPADYEMGDWRDPFVFFNPQQNEYWMLLAARLKQGRSSRRRGCIAWCVSKDLAEWKVMPPFYAPGQYYTHECPDLFQWGEWWYLIYSEFSERWLTHYRMSRSRTGPWTAPPKDDAFDGYSFYAAKTVANGAERFLCGFIYPRDGDRDFGNQVWGGNLVVHQLGQRKDGTLTVGLPDSVRRAFHARGEVRPTAGLGVSRIRPDGVEIGNGIGFACVALGSMPNRCRVRVECAFQPGTRGVGLMLRMSSDLEAGYYIRLSPVRSRLEFEVWPKRAAIPFMVDMERPLQRPLDLDPTRPVVVEIVMDGSIGVAYVNGDTALSFRMYDRPAGDWAVFCEDGAANVRNPNLWT